MFENKENDERYSIGHQFMMALSVDTVMHFQHTVIDLMNKYRANNIDVVPISELENCMQESVSQALGSEGAAFQLFNKGV